MGPEILCKSVLCSPIRL